MFAWGLIIVTLLIILFLPAIVGAVCRLVCRKTPVYYLCIPIGILFTILQSALGSNEVSLLGTMDSLRERGMSAAQLSPLLVFMVVVQIGIYAVFASLGVRLTDRLKKPRQPNPPHAEPAARSPHG